MEALISNWWMTLLPLSYYSAYKLTRLPPGHHHSDLVAPNKAQLITKEQFKAGYLIYEFKRLIRGKHADRAAELQTSVVSYEMKPTNPLSHAKVEVDLVGTIHVGEERYYRELQMRLKKYDCVLFEGVLIRNGNDIDGASTLFECPSNWVLKEAKRFPLVLQKDCLFMRQNWKHADLSWKSLVQLEEERVAKLKMLAKDEGAKNQCLRFMKSILRLCGDLFFILLLCVPVPAFVPLLTYLTCSHECRSAHDIDKLEELLKLGVLHYYAQSPMFYLASKLATLSSDYEGTSNVTNGAILFRERNKAAIEELTKEIAQGKKSIAILYGVGHMPDFHKRLTQELSMIPVRVKWITAWSIKEGPKSKLIRPLLEKFQKENITFILGAIIFAFVAADFWAWRAGFGLYYWVGIYVLRIGCFFSLKAGKIRLTLLRFNTWFGDLCEILKWLLRVQKTSIAKY